MSKIDSVFLFVGDKLNIKSTSTNILQLQVSKHFVLDETFQIFWESINVTRKIIKSRSIFIKNLCLLHKNIEDLFKYLELIRLGND